MDSITLIIAFLLTGAFALPLILNAQKNKKIQKTALNNYKTFSQSQGLTIGEQEFWRNAYYLGLDAHKQILIYSADLAKETPECIDLSGLKALHKQEVSRMSGQGKGKEKIIDRISLELEYWNKPIRKTLEIYDGERFSALVGEPVVLARWLEILSPLISSAAEVKAGSPKKPMLLNH